MAKAYRTVSHEALCVVTGMMPIVIKIEEAAPIYQITKGMDNNNTLFDKDMEVRYWQHPRNRAYEIRTERKKLDHYKYTPMGARPKRESAQA